MLKENQKEKSPVQTKNEHADLIMINQYVKLENEKEILKVVKNYLDCNGASEPIDCIGFLHQDFLEKHENLTEYTPEYLCTLNHQTKELYLFLSRIQSCCANISSSSRVLKLLTPNPA